MEERDGLRNKEGNLNRNLTELESQPTSFETDAPRLVTGHPANDVEVQGTMGDSRPDQIDPEGTYFVHGTDDPNMRISRRTSELHAPEREGAEELAAIRHDDSKIVARPMGPFDGEGAELRPLSADAKEDAEGDDS